MLSLGLNCPGSSGMGRLFDGVAAILGIKTLASYEGQGAVLLEAAAKETDRVYPVVLEGELLRFDWRPMIREIVRDRDRGLDIGVLAGAFLNTLTQMARQMCLHGAETTGYTDVVLSGGSFQNQILMARLPTALEGAGLQVCRHRRVSCNDEGLSLGQLMIAQAAVSAGKDNK